MTISVWTQCSNISDLIFSIREHISLTGEFVKDSCNSFTEGWSFSSESRKFWISGEGLSYRRNYKLSCFWKYEDLIKSETGRNMMATCMNHGHGFEPEHKCELCLISEVMSI